MNIQKITSLPALKFVAIMDTSNVNTQQIGTILPITRWNENTLLDGNIYSWDPVAQQGTERHLDRVEVVSSKPLRGHMQKRLDSQGVFLFNVK